MTGGLPGTRTGLLERMSEGTRLSPWLKGVMYDPYPRPVLVPSPCETKMLAMREDVIFTNGHFIRDTCIIEYNPMP